jgi:hypothetical protein
MDTQELARAVLRGRPSRREARRLAVDGVWVSLFTGLSQLTRGRRLLKDALGHLGSWEGLYHLNKVLEKSATKAIARAWMEKTGLGAGVFDRLADRVAAELTLLIVARYRLGWCPDGHPFAYPPRGRKAEACPKHTARYRKRRWRENKKAWRVPAKLPPHAAKQPPT